MALPFLQGCGRGNSSSSPEGKKMEMRYAVNLTLEEHDGYTLARVRNPWDTLKTLHTYLLVDRDAPLPDGIPKGTVVRTPVRSAVAYSVMHGSLMDELGAGDALRGVCDAQYFTKQPIAEGLQSGRIADCGSSSAPNVERMLMLKPDAVFISPFENSGGYGKLETVGIPIIECADYMETSPLGRAEWVKFYGRLLGKSEQADSMFAATEKSYLQLKERGEKAGKRPAVLMDRVFGQAWNVPGAYSTMGRFIEDAGGRNIFDNHKNAGSTPLAPEQVLYQGKDADIWLIRYSQKYPLTLTQMREDRPMYAEFAPFKSGNVYGVNTDVSQYYSEVAFHPQWLLADMLRVIHPELDDSIPSKRYFEKLSR